MGVKTFYLYCLILTLCLMQTYSFFRYHFSGADQLKVEVTNLHESVAREKLKALIAVNEAESVRQQVAALMPDKLHNLKESYSVRNLASVLQAQQAIPNDHSRQQLEKGKRYFSEGDFKNAIGSFSALNQSYPSSLQVIESHFLLSESYFQVANIDEFIETVQTMVKLFPESELTGFALLRVAAVYYDRRLFDDAEELLLTVKSEFPENPDLQSQANRLLAKVKNESP